MGRSTSGSYTEEFRTERRAKVLSGSSSTQVHRAGNEPPMGETVTMTTAMQGHRLVFKLVHDSGWFSFHATRRSALEFVWQCGWNLKASALDRDATTNAFSGSSPGEVR
jgi:hypothetical protein